MKLTIELVLEKAKQYGDSSQIWDQRSGREQFREGIQIAEIGNADACFQFAERIASLRNVVESGPAGIYSIRHVCAAIWYKSQGGLQDFEHLLRIANRDLTERLLS